MPLEGFLLNRETPFCIYTKLPVFTETHPLSTEINIVGKIIELACKTAKKVTKRSGGKNKIKMALIIKKIIVSDDYSTWTSNL